MEFDGIMREKIYKLKVKVQRRRLKGGGFTFIINLPLECGMCGYRFTRSVQVGVNNPVVSCPFCYYRNLLKLQWHFEEKMLTENTIAEVIVH